jgi:predicted CXXCH cytochrome family protein
VRKSFSSFVVAFILTVPGLIFAGALSLTSARPSSSFIRLYPATATSIRVDNIAHVVYRIVSDSVTTVRAFLPWDSTITTDITTKQARKTVLDTVSSSLPGDLLLGRVTLRAMEYHAKTDTIRDTFQLASRVNAKELLRTDTTMPVTRRMLNKDAVLSDLRIEGWREVIVRPGVERAEFCRGNTVAFPVELRPGLNSITVEMLGPNGVPVGSDTISIFYALSIDPEPAPPGFAADTFHTAANDSSCGSCHTAQAADGSASGGLRCESCHSAQQRQKSVHGLVASNDCATCHGTDPGSGFGLTYEAADENATCFACHDGVQAAAQGKPSIHPPFEGDRCTSCHSPHSSGNARMLRKPVNRLCLTCHDDKGDNNHPVVFHPAGGMRDPRDPGKELSCVSCHNPHASDNNRLLDSPGGYFALCQGCHKK